MAQEFWFGCTVKFDCPACKEKSVEQIVCASPSSDPAPIAKRVSKERLSCQLCKEPLPNDIRVDATVQPATLEQLKSWGFSLPI
jgi:transcription elongation factor Elf1